jgi:hypothetical protein
MLRRVALVGTDVLEEFSASIIRMTTISELGTTLAITSHRCENLKSYILSCRWSVVYFTKETLMFDNPFVLFVADCVKLWIPRAFRYDVWTVESNVSRKQEIRFWRRQQRQWWLLFRNLPKGDSAYIKILCCKLKILTQPHVACNCLHGQKIFHTQFLETCYDMEF